MMIERRVCRGLLDLCGFPRDPMVSQSIGFDPISIFSVHLSNSRPMLFEGIHAPIYLVCIFTMCTQSNESIAATAAKVVTGRRPGRYDTEMRKMGKSKNCKLLEDIHNLFGTLVGGVLGGTMRVRRASDGGECIGTDASAPTASTAPKRCQSARKKREKQNKADMKEPYKGETARANRLHAARKAAGFKSVRAAAIKFGWQEAAFRSHETATRHFDDATARMYADRHPFGTRRSLRADQRRR
jgi:hypothetical protein